MKNQKSIMRFIRHLFSMPCQVHSHFSANGFSLIEQAIAYGETIHGGEIRFVVEAGLHPLEIIYGKQPRERALEVFGRLNIWDTEHNNGVLLYLLIADRDIEVVADRGIASKVPQSVWEEICDHIEQKFKAGEFETGVLRAVEEINAVLAAHYPSSGSNQNELPNQPVIL